MKPLSADHEAFGNAIRELRHAVGLSQEELADKAKMHRTYLGGVERGERNVSLANILRIAAALELPTSELFGRYESGAPRGLRKR
jgi:transcriptional regulator with XRE-family HTH domain